MRSLRPLASLAAFLHLLVAPATATEVSSTKSVLDTLRKAMLSRPVASITSIHTSGSMDAVGIHGGVQEWDDARNARFAMATTGGPLTGSNGWNGKVAWSQDYAGLVTIDGGASGRLQAIDQAYLDNLRYLRPDAGGATVIYAGRRSDGSKTYDILAVTPPAGSEIDLWIDPRTHLIARETATIGIISSTTEVSGYRRVDGITFPFDSSTQTSTGNTVIQHLTSLDVNAPVAERMRVPQSSVHDFTITGTSSTTVPIEIVNNHIYVNVMLDDQGPYRFVLDSGGDYIVTPELAAALRAKSSGGVKISGVGAVTEGASFAQIKSIAIGSAVVRNQYSLVLPIATGFGVSEGLRIDGMIGYQLLARFLTTIDYANSKLTLAMPSVSLALLAGTGVLPFYIDGTIPRVPISVDGISTSAEVDTGNRGTIELSSPFLAAHPALSGLAKTPPGVVGFGVGGPAYARLGRIPTVQLGQFTFSNVIASFTYQTKGAFADPFNPVNIGGGLLRRFSVTFDYPHQQMLLAKNAQYDGPFSYDRSGLFLIDEDGAITVLSVFPGTPAAGAGLRKGDVIVTINGGPASNTTLPGIRTLFAGPAGNLVHLHIRGPLGHERDVTLKLTDYV